MDTKEFLSLFAPKDQISDDRALQLYAMGNGSSLGLPERFTDPEQAAKWASDHSTQHVYFNTCLMMPPPQGGRGGNNHAAIMTALYADLDCCDGHHAGLKPTRAEVMDMLRGEEVLPEPSLIVDSGGGYHAYWLLTEPLKLEGDDRKLAEDLLRGLNSRLADWHTEKGYKYERLKDLARILRPLGTTNWKGEPKEVKLESFSGHRFDPRSLDWAEAETIITQPSLSSFDQVEALQDAILACSTIEAVWNNDASGYIMKCMSNCVECGCSKGTAIQVIRTMESRVGPFPIQWTDQDIGRRYDDSLKQNTLGSSAEKLIITEKEFSLKLVDRLRGRAFYVKEWKKWVAWDGRRFEIDNLGPIVDVVAEMAKEMRAKAITLTDARQIKRLTQFCDYYSTGRGIYAVIDLAKLKLRISAAELNACHDLFHCDNGVIKLGEFCKILPHDMVYKNTSMSNVVYDPEAKCPRWEQFMLEVMDGDEELIRYIQKLLGFCLSGRTDKEAFWILLGEGGNGKGKFTRVVQDVLGEYGRAVRPQLLMDGKGDHPTEIANLFQRRCVFAQETSQERSLNEDQVKNITGGDSLSARRMREDYWEFEPTHKVFLVTNNLPVIKSTDIGMWRRVNVIPFDVSFVADPDERLLEKLQRELSGILNWMIRGYERYEAEGLTPPDRVRYAGEEYREQMDVVGSFVDEWCVRSPDARTPSQTINKAFEFYCEQNGYRKVSRFKLDQDLVRLGLQGGRMSHQGRQVRCKIGLKLDKLSVPDDLHDELFD